MKAKSIRARIRYYYLITLAIFVLILGVMMFYEVNKMVEITSSELATLYSREVLVDVNSLLEQEINLTVSMAKDHSVINWLENEKDPIIKSIATRSLEGYRKILYGHNLFVVIGESQNYYNNENVITYEELSPIGVVDKDIKEDIWYFNSMKMNEEYDLNIDLDRFLNTLRVWINVKVLNENGEPVGVIGTGLHLEPFIDHIFENKHNKATKSIIIDEFGAIQLDSSIGNIKENSYEISETREKTVFRLSSSSEFEMFVKSYLEDPLEPRIFKLNDERFDFIVLSPISKTKWHVVTLFNSKSLYSFERFRNVFIIIGLLIIIILLISNFVADRIFINPFEKLNESLTNNMDLENIKIYGVNRNDEFGLLAGNIQKLKDSLDKNSHNLEVRVAERTTELDELYKKIALNEKKLDRIISTVPVGIFVLDSKREYVFGNAAFLKIFEIVDTNFFKIWLENDPAAIFEIREEYFDMFRRLSNDELIEHEEFRLNTFSGHVFWGELSLNKVLEIDGTIHYEGLLIDITAQKMNEAKLIDQATLDGLTGTYLRNPFLENLNEELTFVANQDIESVLILADFDEFKLINDTYGHLVGDRVLIEITQIIKKAIREKDSIGRLGGEEFAIILHNTSIENAEYFAKRIIELIDEHEIISDGNLILASLSMGVTMIGENDTIESLLMRVDKALYKMKNSGKHGYEIN